MMRSRPALLALAALALAPARPAIAAEAEPGLHAACESSLQTCRASSPSLAEMFSEFDKKPASLGKTPNARFLVLYQACEAVASKDADRCAALDGVAGNMRLRDADRKSYAGVCREYYDDARLTKALLTGDPAAKALCLSRRTLPDLKPGALDAICGWLTDPKADPGGFETRLRPLFAAAPNAADLHHFADGIRQLVGDPAVCGQLERYNSERDSCAEFAAYREARAAADASLCGNHGLCSAMMGGSTQACDAYKERLKDLSYCPFWSDRQVAASAKAARPQRSCLAEALAMAGASSEQPAPGAPGAVARHATTGRDCTAGLTVGGLMADAGEGRFGETAAVREKIAPDALAYYEAATAEDKSPARCSELKPLGAFGSLSAEQECRRRFAADSQAGNNAPAASGAAEKQLRAALCAIFNGQDGPMLPP